MAAILLMPCIGHAQPMQEIDALPRDCRSMMGPMPASGILDWRATVMLEHCDRIKRLQRISAQLPANERPQFFQMMVSRHRLPGEYNVDMPVLRVVFPDRVFFNTAEAELRPEAQQIAAIIAESLRREPPDVTMFVAGHADQRGDADANELLSIRRADALANAVFRAGVNHSSIWRIGFGEDLPLVAGDDEAAWGANRRVEFLFAAKPEPIGSWLADQQMTGLCISRNPSDSEACRNRLRVRIDYQADRVLSSSPPPVRAVARPAPTSVVRPGQGRRGQRSPGNAPAISATPQTPVRVAVTPGAPVRVVVIPKNAPRIIINPANRQATPG